MKECHNPMFGTPPLRKSKRKPRQRRNVVQVFPSPRLVLAMRKR